ncbi:hypothetical protein [Methylorubrum extorquens]|uniref:Uncharacterized protein n=1 Tax=Methylorubrum extorquens (strain ATCC 14718 / DSM 1338 / JCM 2805 / NCIMB 9133 / AM1) TaxID=272630 RepID=C5B651_METEA|nr:hypothetical protein [Methylorubrum extorquens]ACS43933.1 Hypothetical protein MexAM1_META2p1165 [Methylorubrum extorquens AM1]MCP1546216.1 hypothetical protein [Methylorubrum extorquens]MCP1590883.1 hypothetical protein [Methylorubrum extorquens]
MLEVSPIDLQGRVNHHVRHAVLDGTAVPSPAMAAQGSMRAMLERSDAAYARHRGVDAMTNDELRQGLAAAVADRESAHYRRDPEWAEHVEDQVDLYEDELARRERQAGLGR